MRFNLQKTFFWHNIMVDIIVGHLFIGHENAFSVSIINLEDIQLSKKKNVDISKLFFPSPNKKIPKKKDKKKKRKKKNLVSSKLPLNVKEIANKMRKVGKGCK